MAEAKGADYQRRNPLPPADTVGVVTTAGRNFHASTDCRGYQQAIRNSLRHGGTPNPVEHVTAREAQRREKGLFCCIRGSP
jgi:hypothetical protein